MTLLFTLEGDVLAATGLKHDSDLRIILDADGSVLGYAWDGDRLKIDLPRRVFDGREHRVSIVSRQKTEAFTHRSVYKAELVERGERLSGTILDETRPEAAILLDIDLDGETDRTITADKSDGHGFDLANPAAPGQTRLLSLRVRGTDYCPFGKHLVHIDALAVSEALAGAGIGGETRLALETFSRHFALDALRAADAGREAPDLPRSWRFSGPCYERRPQDRIDVIIPVYRGKIETLACIDSVLAAKVDAAYDLIVIDDASPEPALTAALKDHARKHGYTLLHNAENLGFVGTVNRGMALSGDNDVVLLNSDTEVADGWLDRLKAAAYSAPRIATVTPLSNNATILSVPMPKGQETLPWGLDLSGINGLCRRENDGRVIDLPTAHGFCMFIRRDALSELGLFDAETYGKGYGEENDFSMRAATAGWRNLAACDVFVFHKGSVSFNDRSERVATNLARLAETYPDYRGHVHRFIAADPMAQVRNRLQKAMWRDKRLVVFISLSTGGGVDTNIEFLARRLTNEGCRILIARRAGLKPYAYEMAEWNGDGRLYYPSGDGIDTMCADILMMQPAFIHVHHVLDLEDGMDRFLIGSGIPYYVTLHDYFYLCPRVTLLDDGGEYSEVPDFDACNTCLKRGGAHRDMHPSYARTWPDIVAWRDKWHDLLKSACALFAPSQAAADIYDRVFAGLSIEVRPHLGPSPATVEHSTIEAPKKITVALIGGLGAHKGYDTVIALLRWAEKRETDIRFALIGYSDHIDLIRSFPNLEDFGPYTSDTLAEKIRRSGAQVALFVSPWPETYVYTLSEALTHGLTPVAYDLGAPGERLKALGVGELVAPDAPHAKLVKAIRKAAGTRITPKTYSEGDYGSLIDNYYQLAKVHDDRRNDSLLLPHTEGLHHDGWAKRHVVLNFAVRSPVNRLKIDLNVPEDFGPQQVRVHINGGDYGLVVLPPDQTLRRLDIPTRPLDGLIRVELDFSFVRRLKAPDERMAAARLAATAFTHSADPVTDLRPNPLSIRLRPSPDLQLEDAAAIDDTGRLESLYRDVTRYGLHQQKSGLLSTTAGFFKDLMWTARIARRHGPKRGVQAFAAMRSLRRSSFDETFYRLQLSNQPKRFFMDPTTHYVVFGAQDGLDPAPGFSTEFYLKAHTDLARGGTNPFFHYLRHGSRENRRIEPSGKLGLFLQAQTLHGTRADSALGLTALLTSGGKTESPSTDSLWPRRDRPGDGLAIGDIRPDDDILDVAAQGESFLKDFGLLGPAPKWEAAVKALNALPRPSISDKPAVSIVIPVYGQLAYTLNCLHSLLPHVSHHSFEILVGDDASKDASETWLRKVDGIRYIHHAENAGFIENCNKTAAGAKGEFIVLLNNDTRVAEFWLDRLTESFSLFPKAGLVGSKLFYPDGSLQEAGGIVWQDGSAWNYGRHDDPNRPAYCYARKADYVSGAAIAVRKALWDELGGFDTHFRPAYYEDTDLAFRIRDAGQDVIFQPQSKLIHYEGKTSGTDEGGGAKAYQAVNRDKFFERWRDTLASHRSNGEQPSLERDRGVTRRVLIVDACNPTPGQDAGSKATLDLMRYYQTLGFHVSFVPEDNFLYQRTEVSAMQAMGVECFYAPYEGSIHQLLQGNGPLYDVVHLIRANVAFRTIDLVRRWAPQARVFYLNADLHYLRMERQALIEDDAGLLAEAEAMKAKEFDLAKRCDATFVHSDVERDILEDKVPEALVALLPLIENVIDSDYGHGARKDVMFLGGYNHPPNVDAANYLLDEVWPKLSAKLPEAKLLLVGANPPQALKDRASDRVVVTGRVDELAPWFGKARVFVAALRYGAGAKGKVLAAMAHGVPVVATDIAAEGLGLEDGVSVFVANTPDEIAEATADLYTASAREWNRHALDAQDHIQNQHSFEVGLAVVQSVLDATDEIDAPESVSRLSHAG